MIKWMIHSLAWAAAGALSFWFGSSATKRLIEELMRCSRKQPMVE